MTFLLLGTINVKSNIVDELLYKFWYLTKYVIFCSFYQFFKNGQNIWRDDVKTWLNSQLCLAVWCLKLLLNEQMNPKSWFKLCLSTLFDLFLPKRNCFWKVIFTKFSQFFVYFCSLLGSISIQANLTLNVTALSVLQLISCNKLAW